MDIGPVRRRFTAEPISSPVPGADPGLPELPARERTPSPPGPVDVPTPRR